VGMEDGIEGLILVHPEISHVGASGVVKKMILRSKEHVVAVKLIGIDIKSTERKSFLDEVATNYTCGIGLKGNVKERKHPNIIDFYGAIYDPRGKYLGIVMEYVEGGNLFELYKSCKRRSEHVKEGCIRVITQQEDSAISWRSRVLCDMSAGFARVVFYALKIFDPPGSETVVGPR